eukprot:10787846-Heterocapsa_arctica.AAC.1
MAHPITKDAGMWASLGPEDENPGLTIGDIMHLPWNSEQQDARNVSEAIGMRSLQGGTKLNVEQAAGWMITHGVSEADSRGQSGWVQAIDS